MSTTNSTQTETETESSPTDHNQVPESGAAMVRTLVRDDADIHDLVVESPYGYTSTLKDAIVDRWGEDNLPSDQAIYAACFDVRNAIEAGEFDEEADETSGPEPGTVEELSVVAEGPTCETITEPTSSEERVKAVILDDETLIEEAAGEVDEEYMTEVQDRVGEEYGKLFVPTEGTIQSVLSELRLDGRIPEWDEGLEDVDGPANIVYICELCGHDEPSYKAIKHHISNEDDPVHADRSARETHLIGRRGEDIEETHEAFYSEDFEASIDDGFDVLWAIYQNPDARQEDIIDLLDISESTLLRRMGSLGIDWQNREEEVNELIDEFFTDAAETTTIERGNARYSGPETGADFTSGRPGQTIADRPVTSSSGTLTLAIPEEEARDLLTGRDPSAVKQRLLRALLSSHE